MSQSDFGNLSSPLSPVDFFDNRLEPFRDALHSMHSGTTRPSYATAGLLWLNTSTTPWVMSLFDGVNDVAVGVVDPTSSVFSPSGAIEAVASSVDGELVLFNADTGQRVKRATGTGIVRVAGGVMQAPTPGITQSEIPSEGVDNSKLASDVLDALKSDFFVVKYSAPEDGDQDIIIDVPFGYVIEAVTSKCGAGSCTAQLSINAIALGGAVNSVTTSEENQVHSSANVMSVGDDLILSISNNASCEDLVLTIKLAKVV